MRITVIQPHHKFTKEGLSTYLWNYNTRKQTQKFDIILHVKSFCWAKHLLINVSNVICNFRQYANPQMVYHTGEVMKKTDTTLRCAAEALIC